MNGLWTFLSSHPLVALTYTCVVFALSSVLYARLRHAPWANPVLVSIMVVSLTLEFTGIPYPQYFAGVSFLHFLLGPATVALAIPLWYQRERVVRLWLPVLAGILAGGAVAVLTGSGVALAMGASSATIATLVAKSVTTPIAMGLVDKIGGIPALVAVIVIASGVVGAVAGPWLLDRIGVSSPAARGIAMGTAAHGMGTARALQSSQEEGAFAGLALGLHGLLLSLALMIYLALWG